MSTKEKDLRLDTSDSGYEMTQPATEGSVLDGTARATQDIETQGRSNSATVSTRQEITSPTEGYPYGGTGEGNDSR